MRLIDADELKKNSVKFSFFVSRWVSEFDIEACKTIEAEPVRHGHWEWFEEWTQSNTEHFAECEDCGWRCAVCKTPLADAVGGYWDDIYDRPKVNYCPHCGAKMEEEVK